MTTPPSASPLGASFRDPAGFLFTRKGVLYRQVNRAGAEDYTRLITSGLYDRLVQDGLLIPHVEVDEAPADPALAFKVIRPEPVPFLSYPYEWSFSQWKDAALVTLTIQKEALKAGMSLKDASAYNIQFVQGRPMLIDTLSFEPYRPGQPWDAYRQFCQHFLAPLALMARLDPRLGQLMRVHLDGIPLDLAARLLPFSSRFHFGLLTHIHLHAAAQRRYAGADVRTLARQRPMNQAGFLALLDHLENTIASLTWTPAGTAWGDYYQRTNYTPAGLEQKKATLQEWIKTLSPSLVWDLGANIGEFSRLASQQGFFTVAWDIDPAAVEQNYLRMKTEADRFLLPLLIDLTNPSPALGWRLAERESFLQRGPADLVLALALIHHLTISNNVPLPLLADFFADLGQWLIIEWVPKSDSQVEKLLRARRDIFEDYTQENFEAAFARRFTLLKSAEIPDSQRRLYLMQRR